MRPDSPAVIPSWCDVFKNIRSILLFLLLVNSCCQPTAGGEVSVVVLSSLERVLQDDVNVKGPQKAEVFCAKREAESFQIIAVNPTDSVVPDVDLQAGDWKYVGDKPAGVPVLQLFREHYVRIDRPSPRASSRPGMYPDALIPFVNPYTGERITKAKYLAAGQNVASGKSQGYWVDILVGRDIAPGIYTNEITVFSSGKKIAAIPVIATVWNFELPEDHKLKTFFFRVRDVSSYHNVSKDSIEYKVIEWRYLQMLRDHGARCRFEPPATDATGKAIFSNDYVNGLRRFTFEMRPSITMVQMLFDDSPVKRRNYLLSWENFLRRNSWLPEPIAYYDEPQNLANYHTIIEYSKDIKNYAPSVKLVVTAPIKPNRPDLPSLEGFVDIWVPPWYWANPEQVRKWQEAGYEVWTYIHGDSVGVPNWLIDFSLLDYRIPPWFCWSLDLKGILYWQTTSWSKSDVKIDPWVDCNTYPKANFSCGEGSLIYPGYDAGIDGPVASMRLKVFRDSVEDFDYFWILKNLTGRDTVTKVVSPVASSFRAYSKAPNDYVKARKAIAQMILDKSGK
jgi:hypothetical protein